MLEWVGDIGGLFDGFHIVGNAFIAPLAGYAVRTAILSAGFGTIDKDDPDKFVRKRSKGKTVKQPN